MQPMRPEEKYVYIKRFACAKASKETGIPTKYIYHHLDCHLPPSHVLYKAVSIARKHFETLLEKNM